jgi:hypothetical protein
LPCLLGEEAFKETAARSRASPSAAANEATHLIWYRSSGGGDDCAGQQGEVRLKSKMMKVSRVTKRRYGDG